MFFLYCSAVLQAKKQKTQLQIKIMINGQWPKPNWLRSYRFGKLQRRGLTTVSVKSSSESRSYCECTKRRSNQLGFRKRRCSFCMFVYVFGRMFIIKWSTKGIIRTADLYSYPIRMPRCVCLCFMQQVSVFLKSFIGLLDKKTERAARTSKKSCRASPGFEPGTSRTQSENHTPRPTGHPHVKQFRPLFLHELPSRMLANALFFIFIYLLIFEGFPNRVLVYPDRGGLQFVSEAFCYFSFSFSDG